MHIDTENLALSVLKTARSLEKVYEKNGAKSTVAADLFRIYLLQYVLDENSQYSAQIREQALAVLREKIEQKEYIGLSNVETDPQAVSRVLNGIAGDLQKDLNHINSLMLAPDLNQTLENWKSFLVVEKQLDQKYKIENTYWIHQLETLVNNGRKGPIENFENNLHYIFLRQIDYIKFEIRSGNALKSSCVTAEKNLLEDVRHSFGFALNEIEKDTPIEPLVKQKVLEKFEKALNNYSGFFKSFTVSVDEYRNKEEPVTTKEWTKTNTIHG